MTTTDPILFKCRGKCGQLLPEEAFPFTGWYKGKHYRASRCKRCTNRLKWKYRTVELSMMRPYLLEIIHRTGSKRQAAIALGIKHTQLRHWLGISYRYRKDGRRYKSKRMHRDSAAHVLRTLRRLRQENTFYEHTPQKRNKPYWHSVDDKEAERGRKRRKAA